MGQGGERREERGKKKILLGVVKPAYSALASVLNLW